MNLLDTGRSALRSLRANKMRSALTALGIIIGVAAVITMLAVGEGARRTVAEKLKSLGTNLMMVMPGTVTSSGVRISAYGRNTLTEADARAIQDEVPFVVAAAPALRGSGQIIHGNLNWPSQIFGVTPEFLAAREWRMTSGRALDENDLRSSAKVAVVGQTVAQMLFGGTDPVGQTIRVKFVPFTIVGLLDIKGRNAEGVDQDDIVLIPLSTARGRILWQPPGRLRTVGQVSVKMADGADMKQAESQVRELLRQRHRLQPDQDDDFNIRNLSEVVEAEQAASQALSGLLAAVASVSPAGGRHRHHEHHAGLGDGTDPGNRHPPGGRRAAQGYPHPVPGRGGHPVPGGRPGGHRPGGRRHPRPGAARWLERHPADPRHPSFGGFRQRGRRILRLVSGAQGLPHGADRSPAL
jgi:putative ABC transport system permease protein